MNPKLANAQGIYLVGIRDGRPHHAMATYTGDRYTQHSTGIADGPEGFVERNPDREIRILRTIVDGSHVFLHVYQDLNRGEARWVTMDLFDTDNDDRVIEHWDAIAAYEDRPDGDPTQIDGWAGEATEHEQTDKNKSLVARFVDEVLVRHRVDRIAEFVSTGSYVDHHPAPSGGIDGLAAFLGWISPTTQYEAPFRLVGQGSMVATYCRVERNGVGHAVFDLFRVAEGRIV